MPVKRTRHGCVWMTNFGYTCVPGKPTVKPNTNRMVRDIESGVTEHMIPILENNSNSNIRTRVIAYPTLKTSVVPPMPSTMPCTTPSAAPSTLPCSSFSQDLEANIAIEADNTFNPPPPPLALGMRFVFNMLGIHRNN